MKNLLFWAPKIVKKRYFIRPKVKNRYFGAQNSKNRYLRRQQLKSLVPLTRKTVKYEFLRKILGLFLQNRAHLAHRVL